MSNLNNSIPSLRVEQLNTQLQNIIREKASSNNIKNIPSLPLAFNISMPEGYAYEHANLGVAFHDFRLNGTTNVKINASDYSLEGKELNLKMTFPKLELTGDYTITSRKTIKSDLDTAGTMLPFANIMNLPGEGGDDTPTGTFDGATKEKYLNNARTQRERLRSTAKGQKLMATYNEHSETYNDLFKENPILAGLWKGNGATAEMATHTDAALDPSNKRVKRVNPKPNSKKFGTKKVGYNSNAFTQQVNIVVAAALKSKGDMKGKYWQAAKAAVGFGQVTDSSTQNGKKKVTPMSREDVFSTVDKSKIKKAPEISDMEIFHTMNQGNKGGGVSAEIAKANNWIVLDEEDRENSRALIQFHLLEEERKSERIAIPFLQGKCTAEIVNTSLSLKLELSNNEIKLTDSQLEMPSFELDIDDATWEEPIAEVIRARLSQLFFVRSLIQENVSTALNHLGASSAIEAFN